MWVPSLGWEDPLEEGMATHSSILAWRIPRTEEPGGLQSMGSHRVRYDWSGLAARGWRRGNLHLTEEKTEVQRNWVAYPKSQSCKRRSYDFSHIIFKMVSLWQLVSKPTFFNNVTKYLRGEHRAAFPPTWSSQRALQLVLFRVPL